MVFQVTKRHLLKRIKHELNLEVGVIRKRQRLDVPVKFSIVRAISTYY